MHVTIGAWLAEKYIQIEKKGKKNKGVKMRTE